MRIAKAPLEEYIHSLVDAASDWTTGSSSKDYPGYDKIIEKLRNDTFEAQIASGSAWVGTPDMITKQIEEYLEMVGDFEIASLQVNFSDLPYKVARPSMELFAREVMPKFKQRRATVSA
jgi:alkanesulfonate monooxygenase SsuD/methylene tetrahydromethanopterin reductase-like flavin-dependent oxidoreductase (luciferase family)